MNDSHETRTKDPGRELARKIERKEKRKLKARAEKDKGVWFGLGMFGIVGWSVAVPTLMFLAVGVWIDSRWPSPYSWTLMLLVAGVITGCWNAWYWIRKQSRPEENNERGEQEGL